MEATLEKKKQSYVFDRKLTDEEIRELIDNFDYESYSAEVDGNDDYVPAPLWDRFGNPTRDTIAAKYEEEHGLIDGPMTIEELFAEWDEILAETEEEYEKNRTKQIVQAGLQTNKYGQVS